MFKTALSREFQDYLDELCRNNDISAVAAELGIGVKHSGNSYSCCCPFHAEKTPSCHLYIDDNHFHCFGCGAHGNVIKFVMQAENTDFMNAVEMLSNRVGMVIPRGNGGKKSGYNSAKRSYEKNDYDKRGYSPQNTADNGYMNAENNRKGDCENSQNTAQEPPAEVLKQIYESIPDEDNRGNYAELDKYPTENVTAEDVAESYANVENNAAGSANAENNAGNNANPDYYDGFSRKKRIYEINQQAGRFFHEQLFSPAGKVGLDYLTGRGLTVDTIKRFGLGFAPDDYHALHYYMKGLGYSDAELKECALISTRDGRKFYDKFRNRVMFPVFDEQMRVIAFGGRIMTDDKKAPKYLNSDETPVFQKRRTLYALNYAKKSSADYFIICEGYMDVIAMHQAGFDSAVASLGTAITAEQATLLSKRGKNKIVLSYDSDSAGQKATSKAIGLFMQTAVEKVNVLKISGAKDPDEYIKKFGAEPFRSLIDNAIGAVSFEMERLSSGLNMGAEDERNIFIRRTVRYLAEVEDKAFREFCAEKASMLANVTKNTVLDAVNALIEQRRPFARNGTESRTGDSRGGYFGESYDESKNGEDFLSHDGGTENAEKVILAFLYHNSGDLDKIGKKLGSGLITDFGRRFYAFLEEKIRETGEICTIDGLSGEFPEEMGRISEIINDANIPHSEKCLDEAVEKLNSIKRKAVKVSSFAELDSYINNINDEEGEE